MKKIKVLLLTAAIIAAGTGVYLRASAGDAVEVYEQRPTVSTTVPEPGDILLYTELTGSVEPQSKASVMPKMGGEVMEVYFQAGDYVEAGTILCKIDSDALTTLKLQLDSAQVTLNDANKNLSRMQVLFSNGDIPEQSLEQARNAAENARIGYESARNQYELNLEYTTVTAPISGTVESRHVEPHEYVGPSGAICVISAKEQLRVNFGVTEKILGNLALGDTVRIEKNGSEYSGVVTEISSMVNPASGLYDVKASISESRGLTTGTKVKLTVLMSQARNVMTIPLDTVRYDDGKPFVYCYEDGLARKTYITSGIYDSGRMEVSSGLTRESRIITTWSNELADGEEVLLKEAGEAHD